jgi:ABC-type multidrug transport system ATPase subunit
MFGVFCYNLSMAVIKVENISKNFGTLKAVDNLSFEVEAGQVFGFLGQNGSGKSTTIRMLLSLIHPSSGSIELFGKSIQKNRASILEQVGAIIERPDLYPYLTATEHLQLFAKVRKQKVAAINITKTLEQVGLSHRSQDKVQTFSLGMKQRLGIAIALVHNPSLIILDEPTNGLDPQGIADIRSLIQYLAKEEGKTVFVSSHLLSEIEQVANQILIIHQGKKMVEGVTKELLDPEKRIVQIKTLDDVKALSIIVAGSFSQYLLSRKEGIFLKLPTTAIPMLNESLVQSGIAVLGIETKNSLEDYFLQITSNA